VLSRSPGPGVHLRSQTAPTRSKWVKKIHPFKRGRKRGLSHFEIGEKINFDRLFTLSFYLRSLTSTIRKNNMAYRFKKNYYVTETCECGAKRHVKDHGSWIGFYCPTCEQGGSRSKHERKHFSKHSRGWAHTLP